MTLPSYSQALKTILTTVRLTDVIEIPVHDCLGSVLAADVISAVNIPPFDNSAMDGFAVKASDVTQAGATLRVLGTIAAGQAPLTGGFEPGNCYQIMTGAPVPEGTDTIIPVELSKLEGGFVTFTEAYETGRHIRPTATDFAQSDILFTKGQKVSAQMLPALCSVGLGTVKVYAQPSVVWLSTGEELSDAPGDQLAPGKIFNSSGPYGQAVLPAFGAALKWRRTIPDDLDLFRASLHQAAEEKIDVIISTGAVSVGIYDFVRKELEAAGWEILLHRAKVKPGKPILFARLKGTGDTPERFFFGLPGNPVSSAMGLRVFVAPFLRAMQNRQPEMPFYAAVQGDVKASEGLTVFMKAFHEIDEDGQSVVRSLDAQQSYQVGAMGAMNCWLIHPEGEAVIDDGFLVECLPFLPHD